MAAAQEMPGRLNFPVSILGQSIVVQWQAFQQYLIGPQTVRIDDQLLKRSDQSPLQPTAACKTKFAPPKAVACIESADSAAA